MEKNNLKTKLFKCALGIVIGLIGIGIVLHYDLDAMAQENNKGYSTLPGWSFGYKFNLDLDESKDSKLRLFGKYKEKDGTSYKLGWDKKTGTNLNDWNEDQDGVIFFEHEIKF